MEILRQNKAERRSWWSVRMHRPRCCVLLRTAYLAVVRPFTALGAAKYCLQRLCEEDHRLTRIPQKEDQSPVAYCSLLNNRWIDSDNRSAHIVSISHPTNFCRPLMTQRNSSPTNRSNPEVHHDGPVSGGPRIVSRAEKSFNCEIRSPQNQSA